MKREDQILIDLLADFVNGQSPGALPEVSLDALYQTACKHNVTGVVAEMLHPFLENAEEPAVRKLQESHMATVFRSVLLKEEVKLFSARMEEEKIPYAFFKGYELRELYPVPELRTMGDVDVLVRDEDLERTAEVLCGLGYQKEEGGSAVWALKKDNFSYEVHRRLAFGSYWNDVDYEGYFAAAFDRLTTGEGSRRYFTPEDFWLLVSVLITQAATAPDQLPDRRDVRYGLMDLDAFSSKLISYGLFHSGAGAVSGAPAGGLDKAVAARAAEPLEDEGGVQGDRSE